MTIKNENSEKEPWDSYAWNGSIHLAARAISSHLPQVNEKAIHNATTKSLPPETEIIYSLGPKFAMPITDINNVPFYHIISDVENIIKYNTNTKTREQTRCSIANIIQNYIHGFDNFSTNNDPLKIFCKRAASITKTFLSTNEDIIVLKADKGNKTVVMYKEDYKNKMQILLDDPKTYNTILRDPTSRHQTTNNNLAKRLKELKLIDQHTYKKLSTHNAICPRIYGAPKAHKPDLPLRPVVPNMTAPSYEMSKYIGKILQQSIEGKYNVKDSFSFCAHINTVRLLRDMFCYH